MFGSLITAMITPFDLDEAIDYAAVDRLVEHLVATGTDSIIVSGTTGESPTLTHEEEIELLKAVQAKVKKLGSATKIIFGAGSNSTATAVEMSLRAEAEGADALLHVVPYYNKPSQAGMISHFSKIASSTKLPIILYNIPGRCVVNMKAETIIHLAKNFDNIVALKEASNNIDQISAIRQELSSEQFKLYSGDDSLTLAMMAVGADGVISVASHLSGIEMKEMIRLFVEGKQKEAQAIHSKLFPLFQALFVEPNPTCLKAALSMLGLCLDTLRSPLVPLDEKSRSDLKALLDTLDLRSKLTT